MPPPDRTAPSFRHVVNALVALSAILWAIAGMEANPAGAAVAQAMAEHQTHAGPSGSLTTGQKGVAVHGRKEGWLAVTLSVLGIIVVVVAIVGLGSFSVRRRSGNPPPGARREWPERWRGPFG